MIFLQHPNSTSLATVAIRVTGTAAGLLRSKGNPNSIHCAIVVEGQEDGRKDGDVTLAHVRKGGHIIESMLNMFKHRFPQAP